MGRVVAGAAIPVPVPITEGAGLVRGATGAPRVGGGVAGATLTSLISVGYGLEGLGKVRLADGQSGEVPGVAANLGRECLDLHPGSLSLPGQGSWPLDGPLDVQSSCHGRILP